MVRGCEPLSWQLQFYASGYIIRRQKYIADMHLNVNTFLLLAQTPRNFSIRDLCEIVI